MIEGKERKLKSARYFILTFEFMYYGFLFYHFSILAKFEWFEKKFRAPCEFPFLHDMHYQIVKRKDYSILSALGFY